MYAKMIGDEKYKEFDDKIVISEYMESNITNQLKFRINEYKKFI